MAPTRDARVVSLPRRFRQRLARFMDTLARGASPPGMIDMFPPRPAPAAAVQGARPNALLRRRFTMIARYEQNVGRARRWSATGVTLSLLLCAVALTGAVRADDEPAKPEDNARPAASAAPAPAAPAAPAQDRPARFTRDDAEKLWRDKYADRIIVVQGREANREQVDADYLRELAQKGYSPEPQPQPIPSGDVITAEEAAMQAQLGRRIPEMNFDAVAIADVLDYLRDLSGANIFVEWKALENAGVDRTTPVTLRAKNVQLSHALEMVLDSAGGGSVPLGYSTRGGVIRISVGEQLDKVTEIRAYDVRDIVPAEMEMKALEALVKESVQPDSWRDAGGTTGAVHTSKHKMIVTTTEQNHREIRRILEMLREQPQEGARTESAANTARAKPSAAGQ